MTLENFKVKVYKQKGRREFNKENKPEKVLVSPSYRYSFNKLKIIKKVKFLKKIIIQ